MIKFIKFYIKNGIRRKDDIKSPPIDYFTNFIPPINSVLHFVDQGDDDIVVGIEPDSKFIRNLEKNNGVVVKHNLTYSESVDLNGMKVVRSTIKKNDLVKGYHRKNPSFIKGWIEVSKGDLINNVNVVNHTLIDVEYNYTETVLSEYYRIKNYWQSIFDDVRNRIKLDTKNHFVPIELPDTIPSRSLLKKWETESKESNWKKIKTESRFLITEFMAFLSGIEGVIPKEPDIIERLNILFYYKSVYFTVNLGSLNKMIIREKKTKEATISPDDARKLFLIGLFKTVLGDVSVGENEIDKLVESDDASDEPDFTSSKEEVKEFKLKNSKLASVAEQGRVIGTIEELLKIGIDKGVDVKVPRNKLASNPDDALIFNSELQEDDEAQLQLMEDIEDEGERQDEKVEILKEVGYTSYKGDTPDLTTILNEKIDTLASEGRHTSAEIRRFKNLSSKWENIEDYKGSGKKAVELVKVTSDELILNKTKIAESIPGVLDDSMLYTNISEFNKEYTDKIMHRHLLAGAVKLQKVGLFVTDHKVISTDTAFDSFETHSFKIVPLEGDESTMRLKLHKVDEDGNLISGGVKSRLRLQRMDLPIRKINHNEVALTSFVNKFFVVRSEFSAYSQEQWLEKQLIKVSNERKDVKINFANSFDRSIKAPLMFTILSRLCNKIEIGDLTFNFDVSKFNTIFGKDLMDQMKTSKKMMSICGKHKSKNRILIMDEFGMIFSSSTEKRDDIEKVGTIESILSLDDSTKPVDMVYTTLLGQRLPIGFLLSYFIGLGNLIETIGCSFRRVPKNTRGGILEDEFGIRFADETLAFKKNDYKAMLVFGGFRELKNEIKRHSVYSFDLKEVYGSVLLDMGISARYLKSLEVMRQLWIDPITENILTKMNEPTDFVLLLLSAVDRLCTDFHEESRDEKGYRLRGYERIPGFAYKEMVNAVIQFEGKPSRGNRKLEINPLSAWMKVLQDKSGGPVEESNPIHSLKEQEIVVYRGDGGRDGRTLNSESRKYHINSIGILSENTVDNSDAGAVSYLTASPNINSLLGTTTVVDKDKRKNIEPTELLSTSLLLSPCIEFDDPKRRNFTSIQNSRTTNCMGLTLLPLRTGYENVLPYRVSKQYCFIAREKGKVVEVTKNIIRIRYNNGKEEVCPLGLKAGKWQGKMVPHELITELKVGDVFKEGTAITYNPLFFTYNWFTGCLSYKMGLLANVMLVENDNTLEDSSAMSKKFTEKLDTYIIEQRSIFVEFNQEIENLVKIGDKVEFDTFLCNLLDTLSTTSTSKLFTEESREILKDVSSINPKAEVTGKVVSIDVVYCGEPDDMTDTLRDIVDKADRDRGNRSKELNKGRQDGSVNAGFRVDGIVMERNLCVINVGIECIQTMRTGSKIVVSHQMKSVTGNVWEEPVLTESGREVDLEFGYQSLQNRVVPSAELVGTTNNLLVAGTAAVIKAFRGK